MNHRQKIIERIRKLIAMSEDVSSPEEAAIAARRVKAMLKNYEFVLADVLIPEYERREGLRVLVWGGGRRSRPHWMAQIVIALGISFNIKVTQLRGVPGFVFCGFEVDVAAAIALSDYICGQVFALAATANPPSRRVPVRRFRRQFRLACALVVAQRIGEFYGMPEDDDKSPNALVVRTKAMVVRAEFSDFDYKKERTVMRSHGAFAGAMAGRTVNISRGVESQSSADRALPSPENET